MSLMVLDQGDGILFQAIGFTEDQNRAFVWLNTLGDLEIAFIRQRMESAVREPQGSA